MQIGLLRSSRGEDIQRLFARWYPQAQVNLVTSVSALDCMDALLAGGGRDISPALYGQPNRAANKPDHVRDSAEQDVIAAALQRGIPFLGLCRGAQLLNVVLGGSLYQDLTEERGKGHPEQHDVVFSGAACAYLGPQASVNSTHHQGVQTLGQGLTVVGVAHDGLAEAWHRPGAIGVQFHPETMVHQDDRWVRLFQWWLDGAA